MGRPRYELPESTETRYDNLTVGGGKQVIHHDKNHTDGDGTLVGGSAPEAWDETNRYRGLGEAAAKRQAYQADFGKAMGDEAQGLQARGQQDAGLRYMRQAAMGNAPSQAAILGNQVGGQSLQASMQAGAGGRGLGAAAAQMQAQQAQQGVQLAGLGQYTGMRGGEMAHAQSAFGQASGQMRSGDYAQQGMAQQRADAQAQSEMTQRQLNQAGQMGLEQMGINNQQAQSDANIRRAAMQNKQNSDNRDARDAETARSMKVYTSVGNAMGTTVGDPGLGDQTAMGAVPPPKTSNSDERGKTSIKPMSSQYMLSDDHTKLVAAQREAFTAGLSHANQAADTGELGEAPAYMRAKPSTEKHQPAAGDARAASTTVAKRDGAHQRDVVRASSQDMARAAIMTNPVMPPSVQLGGDLMRADVEGRSLAMRRQAQAPASLPPMEPAASYSDERTKDSAHAEQDMGAALAQGFKPFEYEYKPGFREQEGQAPGEKNVGPMAQDMASNSITGSAVKKRPDGLLVVDIPKATKVNSAGIGYLAAKMQKQDAEIARLNGGR